MDDLPPLNEDALQREGGAQGRPDAPRPDIIPTRPVVLSGRMPGGAGVSANAHGMPESASTINAPGMEKAMAEDFPSANTSLHTAREALLAQLDKAAEGMEHRSRSDVAIHDIRKELKRARASLRMLRECIGVAEYRRDNALIRDAARPLTPVRDAKVLLEAFQRLRNDGMPNGGAFAAQFHKLLKDQRLDAQRRLRPAELVGSVHALRDIGRRASRISDRKLALADTGGLKRAYKSGRRALAHAEREKTDECLHEWRKQTKYLANQLEIVVPFGPKRFKKSHKQAKQLADQLGEDHDLALLTEQIYRHATGRHAPGRDDKVQEMVSFLASHRKRLQRKAFKLGRRLYAAPARRYRP
jgi:CHAD domain-containing protein